MTYLWLKAGHIIFVIFWIAGLFMLPRYYVYHQESRAGLGRGDEVDRARAQAAQDHPHAGDDPGLGASA